MCNHMYTCKKQHGTYADCPVSEQFYLKLVEWIEKHRIKKQKNKKNEKRGCKIKKVCYNIGL